MKLAVIGSRQFLDFGLLSAELDGISGITEIISGAANGTDTLAKQYALDHGLLLTEFPAEYKLYGRKATHVRNDLIVKHCDKLIAFWDEQSLGTKSMILKAQKAHKLLRIVKYGKPVDICAKLL